MKIIFFCVNQCQKKLNLLGWISQRLRVSAVNFLLFTNEGNVKSYVSLGMGQLSSPLDSHEQILKT